MKSYSEELDRCEEMLRTRLYLLLENTDLSVLEFCRRARIHANTLYSFFYRKTRLPSVGTLYCISKAYNVSIDWMLGYPCRSKKDEEKPIGS